MPYNSYRFSCEHVLLKRLSFLSKLSIILNCHSKKGYFLSMGEGVLSQTAAGWAGYTPAHTEACTCKQTHTWIDVHVHSAHTLLSQCSHPPPATGATPAQLVAAAVGQWGWPYHSQGTGLGTLGGQGKSVPNQSCQKIIMGAGRRQSFFSPHSQVDVCGKCSVFYQSSGSSFVSSNSVFIV